MAIAIYKCHSNQLAIKGVIYQVFWLPGGCIHTVVDGDVWGDREILGKCELREKSFKENWEADIDLLQIQCNDQPNTDRLHYLQSSKY